MRILTALSWDANEEDWASVMIQRGKGIVTLFTLDNIAYSGGQLIQGGIGYSSWKLECPAHGWYRFQHLD